MEEENQIKKHNWRRNLLILFERLFFGDGFLMLDMCSGDSTGATESGRGRERKGERRGPLWRRFAETERAKSMEVASANVVTKWHRYLMYALCLMIIYSVACNTLGESRAHSAPVLVCSLKLWWSGTPSIQRSLKKHLHKLSLMCICVLYHENGLPSKWELSAQLQNYLSIRITVMEKLVSGRYVKLVQMKCAFIWTEFVFFFSPFVFRVKCNLWGWENRRKWW